jgi:microcystin-dependent protein
LGYAGGELAALDNPQRQTFAVPGQPGRIPVTTGMLCNLDGGQRRALLSHDVPIWPTVTTCTTASCTSQQP